MPIVFTNQFKTTETMSDENSYEPFDYGEYSNIKLLHTETGSVEELNLDIYLYGVVASEMPADFEEEALKAQATVARTYTIYQMKNGNKHENADVCDSSYCCQAWISKENRMDRWEEDKKEEYWNKITKAVNDTKGKVILYNNEPINALFHSNSGGSTELSINVWGGDFPYFQTVETSGEENYSSYSSEVEISKDDLVSKMIEKNSKFEINFQNEDAVKILEYTDSGRVSKIQIGNTTLSGVEARSLFGLKSSKFSFEILENSVKFSVLGYGHGVGLSQCGSDYLAKQGKNFEEIIKYYYKNVEISE
jgi:stage II sporulation protein D